MNCYEFTIVAGGLPIDSDDWQDRFFEAGCDDAVIVLERGQFVLHFDREAHSAEEALTSAAADVARTGASIVRFEPDPLVSASDIAERADLTRQAISLYANGARGGGFPPPVACVSGSRPLWKWSEVAAWLFKAEKVEQAALDMALLIDRLNDVEPDLHPRAEAATPTVAVSQYSRLDFYLSGQRRLIDKPVFQHAPSRNSRRQRDRFALRPIISMVQ